jgi:endonuclease/exonuclease/phosphatase family metal-dependent hydrolase
VAKPRDTHLGRRSTIAGMRLLSWNVQWCRGVDGKVDPARIAQTARALCDPDVLCLQEVAANYPALAGSRGEDQLAALAGAFPGFSAIVGWSVDVPDDAGASQSAASCAMRCPGRPNRAAGACRGSRSRRRFSRRGAPCA